jgi:hypothetical protein
LSAGMTANSGSSLIDRMNGPVGRSVIAGHRPAGRRSSVALCRPVRRRGLLLTRLQLACTRSTAKIPWKVGPTAHRNSMNPNRPSSRGAHRRRAPLIVVLVIPALCAFAVKSARASFYKVQPILCDGVDDDTAAPSHCALPEEKAKDFSTKARPHTMPKIFVRLTSPSRVARAGSQRPISSADSSPRFKRLLAQDTGSSSDPDGSH